MKTLENIAITHIGEPGSAARSELREALALSSCEVSINRLDAGQAVPFVHAHRQNEEVYLILSGSGHFWLDGSVHAVRMGDALRVDPAVERCLKASDTENLTYICVQARKGATESVTRSDGFIIERSITWN